MHRPLAARALVALPLLATLAIAACRRSESAAAGSAGPPAKDPQARLSQLLRRGAQPGELTLAERGEVERLLQGVLPRLEGPLAGDHWRVAYDDLPVGDFVSIDLMEGSGEAAPRAIWFHLLWRGPLTAAEQPAWTLRVGRWPARGVPGHHLFVRAGGVELRAVADDAAYRDDAKLRDVLGRFDLDALSRL